MAFHHDADAHFMSATLDYSLRGLGISSPNPAVGALVVKDTTIIGQGFTQKGGRPHAELVALQQAGTAAKGATLYVTLEPCSHIGRGCPCTQWILKAGISRVVAAMQDPDPRVAGTGFNQLRLGGVEVDVGLDKERARKLHLGHVLAITQNRPMITLKLAKTADGFAAGHQDQPRLLISGADMGRQVQLWRSQHDGIMVGVRTILADDPQLNIRIPTIRQPLPKIILDRQLATPETAAIFRDPTKAEVIIFTGPKVSKQKQQNLLRKDAKIIKIQGSNIQGSHERLDLRQIVKILSHRGHRRIFCEGGPTLARSLFNHDLVDHYLEITNQRLYAHSGLKVLHQDEQNQLAEQFKLEDSGGFGDDLWQSFYKHE